MSSTTLPDGSLDVSCAYPYTFDSLPQLANYTFTASETQSQPSTVAQTPTPTVSIDTIQTANGPVLRIRQASQPGTVAQTPTPTVSIDTIQTANGPVLRIRHAG